MSPAPILPVTRTRDEARRGYDRLSRVYDLVAASEVPFMRAGLRLLAPRPGERILEVGPGTGRAIVDLARAVGPKGRVHGLDLSPRMIERARARADAAGVGDRVALDAGDAARLPFQDRAFDAVFSSFTLELFDTPEIPVVLAEVRRVLHPGGRLVVVAMAQPDAPSFAVRLYTSAHARWPTIFDCRPIPAARLIAEAGFRVTEAEERAMWGLPVAIVRADPIA